MQDYNARGTIERVLAQTDDVFIFAFKTAELLHPLRIKVKKFRKGLPIETFVQSCKSFTEHSNIAILSARISTEKAMNKGAPVKTSDGHDVWAPVIVADIIILESACLQHPEPQDGNHGARKDGIATAPVETTPNVPVRSALSTTANTQAGANAGVETFIPMIPF
jgi:hypothetical protein